MNLTFHGGKELVQALRQLPREVRRKVLGGAVLAGAGIVQRSASEKAPRDEMPRRRRGKRLAESIKSVVTEETPSSVTANVTTSDPVAHLQEYGHQKVPRGPNRRRVSVTRVSKTGRVTTRLEIDPDERRRRRNTGSTGFTPPKPFLRPAFDENKEVVLRKIGEVLSVGIEAEAQRLASTDHSAGRWVSGGGIAGGA